MKLILTGSNGFIGLHTLRLALANPAITSLIALSRKPLPEPYTSSSHPKLRTLIIQDFASYPQSALDELDGSEACIWTIGAKSTDPEVNRKVGLEYSTTALRTFAHLKRRDPATPFRFIFTSGIVTVRDQKKSVWFFEEARKIGGLVESELIRIGQEMGETEVYAMRPAFVLTQEKSLFNAVRGVVGWSVRVDEVCFSYFRLGEEWKKGIWLDETLLIGLAF